MKKVADQGQIEPGLLSLARLQEGAALQRRTGLPVLVSGGSVDGAAISLADMMARSLQQDFQVPTRWKESGSADTWQNAQFSAALLEANGISRVYVVTQAWHMRRALYAFRHFGIDALPASVLFDPWPKFTPGNFVPSASAWHDSYYGFHEWIGLAYYWFRR